MSTSGALPRSPGAVTTRKGLAGCWGSSGHVPGSWEEPLLLFLLIARISVPNPNQAGELPNPQEEASGALLPARVLAQED